MRPPCSRCRARTSHADGADSSSLAAGFLEGLCLSKAYGAHSPYISGRNPLNDVISPFQRIRPNESSCALPANVRPNAATAKCLNTAARSV